jgi:hypothetical protein
MEDHYEIWAAPLGNYKLGELRKHVLLEAGVALAYVTEACESFSHSSQSSKMRVYYRKLGEPSYAINITAPAGLVEDEPVVSTYEIAYNRADAEEAAGRHRALHTKHSTGCIVSIAEVDEIAVRREAKCSAGTYGEFIEGTVGTVGTDDEMPELTTDDSSEPDDTPQCNCPNCRGENVLLNDVTRGAVEMMIRSGQFDALYSEYMLNLRAGTVDEFARSLDFPRMILEVAVVGYLATKIGMDLRG